MRLTTIILNSIKKNCWIKWIDGYQSKKGVEDVMFKDKTLLITGGTGSFGNAVMERFLDTTVKEIRIFFFSVS